MAGTKAKPQERIAKSTDFMEISLIMMSAKLLILGLGWNRIRVEIEQILVNLAVPLVPISNIDPKWEQITHVECCKVEA